MTHRRQLPDELLEHACMTFQHSVNDLYEVGPSQHWLQLRRTGTVKRMHKVFSRLKTER